MTIELTKEQDKQLDAIYGKWGARKEAVTDRIDDLTYERGGPAIMPPLPEKGGVKAVAAWSEACEKAQNDWFNAGPDDWREEYQRLTEEDDRIEAELARELERFKRAAIEANFDAIRDDRAAVLQDAKEIVDHVIAALQDEARSMTEKGGVKAKWLRATKRGYKIDADYLRDRIEAALYLNRQSLDETTEEGELDAYITNAIGAAVDVSATEGEPGALVTKTNYDGVLVSKPTEKISTTDKLTRAAFLGITKNGKDIKFKLSRDPEAYYETQLDKKGKEIVKITLDSSSFEENTGVELSVNDLAFLGAVMSNIRRGNRTFTTAMVYQAKTARPVEKITPAMEKRLDKFLNMMNVRVKISYSKTEPDGTVKTFEEDEPMLMFTRKAAKINGKTIKKAIVVPETINGKPYMPILYRWAEFNGDEIDTRPLSIMDVGLSSTEENDAIKETLYQRIIWMKNETRRKKANKYELAEGKRRVRFDYLYKRAEIDPDKLDANKRRKVKEKVDICLNDWKGKLFTSYKYLRDEKHTIYAIEFKFLPKES